MKKKILKVWLFEFRIALYIFFSKIIFTFSRVNGTQSILDYVPRTEMDYGSVLCWASNSVGRQSQPCVFHIVPAGEYLK